MYIIDRIEQEVFILTDEKNRDMMLQMTKEERQTNMDKWTHKISEHRDLFIAATSAKKELLTTEERRTLTDIDEEEYAQHMHKWKLSQSDVRRRRISFKVDANSRTDDTPKKSSTSRFIFLAPQKAKGFKIPKYWMKVIKKKRDTKVLPMPLVSLRNFIRQMYSYCCNERIDNTQDLIEYVIQYLTLQFGMTKFVESRVQSLINGLEQHYTQDTWILTFCRFCGVSMYFSKYVATFRKNLTFALAI